MTRTLYPRSMVTRESAADQAQAAFNRAIRTGRLTEASARDYMFMGFDAQGRAAFKHRDTRQYLPHEVTP